MSYRGLNPLVYSRFGYRQWAAPLPGVTVVIKDPFAMLSLPAVHQVTSAIPVLLFRHPGAALTSYRRMGWSPDLRELAPIVDTFLRQHGQCAGVTPLPADAESDEIVAMAWFWKALYGMALYDAERLEQCVVVAHHDVAEGGEMFCRALFDELGLRWSHRVDDQLTRQDSVKPVVDQATLHNFDRPPTQVAREWESKVIPEERARIEHETADVLSLLADRAFRPAVA